MPSTPPLASPPLASPPLPPPVEPAKNGPAQPTPLLPRLVAALQPGAPEAERHQVMAEALVIGRLIWAQVSALQAPLTPQYLTGPSAATARATVAPSSLVPGSVELTREPGPAPSATRAPAEGGPSQVPALQHATSSQAAVDAYVVRAQAAAHSNDPHLREHLAAEGRALLAALMRDGT